jgi:glycosyltransferase involved in cell wall biosynthesis
MKRSVVVVLGPHREAVSGVSTHLNLLLASRLAREFALVHFQVGSEGRAEGRVGRLVRLMASPVQLAIALLARRAAIVHLNTSLNARAYWRDLAYLLVAKACGSRVLYQVHGGALPQRFFGRSRILAACLRGVLQLPDVIVVLARVELEAYRAFVPRQQIVRLPNGIDCALYPKFQAVHRDPSLPLQLLYMGRLAREKGLYDVLEGLRIARAQGAQTRLVIAGSGPEEAALKRRVRQLGLASTVAFVGPMFGESKVKLLGESDAFFLTSYAEGLPYALLEGMAAGMPVIATPVGAIPDVVVDGVHGLLVPPRDPEAIARAVERLASDRAPFERMSAACRERIAAGYSIDRLAGRLSRLYSELCSAKRMKALTQY